MATAAVPASSILQVEGTRVELRNLSKVFDGNVRAIDDVSLQFESGKLTTLLGPSGCGKTTTLRCIAGFSEPTSGSVMIDDSAVDHTPPYDRPTSTVFQNYALFPHMTVSENIAYGLRLKHLSKDVVAKKVQAGLRLLKLDSLGDRSPAQLSGGQQQRVAIARALVTEPKVLLLDEPLSNLDAKLRVYMRTELRQLQQRLGITTIYVTHDQEEAMAISDKIVVMRAGKVEQAGSPVEVYRNPSSPFVADFIGITNLIEGTLESLDKLSAAVRLGPLLVRGRANEQLPTGAKVQLVLRPEMIRIGTPGGLRASVLTAAFTGILARYDLRLETGHDIIVFDYNPREILEPGREVTVSIADDDVPVRRGWSLP